MENHDHNSPPGPRGCPFVGSLPALSWNLLGFFQKISLIYGRVSSFRLGRKSIYLVTHPGDIAKIFAGERKGLFSRQFFHQLYKPVFGNGVFNSYGEDWKHQREILQPYFQKRETDKWFPFLYAETETFINAIASGQYSAFHAEKEVLPFLQSIMCRFLFGQPLEDSRARNIVDGIATVGKQTLINSLFAFIFRWNYSLEATGNAKFQQSQAMIDQAINDLRIEALQNPDCNALIKLLDKHFSAKELRDHTFTIFFAAQDTTVNDIAFTLFYLAKHPDIQAKARREIENLDATGENATFTLSDLKKLTFVGCVISESLRLSPPFYAAYRDVLGAQQLNGYTLKDDSLVVISPYVTHRHPDFWDDPDSFKPERFIERESKPFTYYPYGGGMRTCLGMHFAQTHILIFMVLLLQKFQWTLAKGYEKPKFVPFATLRAKHGIKLQLQKLL
ncbi:MAG: cytochrome P450 [Methylococcaceae bacterium]